MMYPVETIKIPVGTIFTYCYVIEAKRFVILIDSGVASAAQKVDAVLDTKNLQEKPLVIINTHGHWDHSGLNGYLQRNRKAITMAHRNARKWMSDKDFHFTSLYTSLLSEFPYDDDKKKLFYAECGESSIQNISLEGGELFEDENLMLEIIHTPGHSNCSICIYDHHSKSLFSGDSLQGYGMLGNLPFYCDAAFYEKTVQKMKNYEVDHIYGGHITIDGRENCSGFLQDCVDGFYKNDRVIRNMLKSSDRREATLTDISNKVAKELGLLNNIQMITSVRAQIRFIDDEC